MVTNTTAAMEVVETGEKRDRRGRRITPAGRREELVTAWRQSGMTQAAFAQREGIHYTTFRSWVRSKDIGDKQNGEMGYTLGQDALEDHHSDGGSTTIRHPGSDRPVHGHRSVRAIWNQPEDGLQASDAA